MIEEGIIIESENGTAKVRVTAGQNCLSCGCGSTGSCLSGKQGERIISVLNKASAKTGDRVLIEISSNEILKSSFIAYIIPIFFLFIGGVTGGWVSSSYPSLGTVDTLASIFGILFLVISIIILYFLNKKPHNMANLMPVIKSILR